MAKKKKNPMKRRKKTYPFRGEVYKSKLELEMCKQLYAHKIQFAYEKHSFDIIDGFKYENTSYEKFQNGNGDYKDRGNKRIAKAVYTPDFTPPPDKEITWIIEVKGRMMPGFPMTWKLFKKYLTDNNMGEVVIFMPRNKKDCEETARIIKNLTKCQTN